MTVDSTEDLFVDGLKHAYYTEQRLVDALEELEQTLREEQDELDSLSGLGEAFDYGELTVSE
ncbi:hypothetical protein [Natrinema salaciae]|uniref:Uncharacterized protein n=1 Tax=Natrinema salaciae TaxID=1186196 RepID=A0A1H9GAZ3_9EURY|nr:hypothetical protein [Natrinema salaciae]SEQ47287.1 hypothetical protein SAMN04489841_1831 [Natrinema salaciae]